MLNYLPYKISILIKPFGFVWFEAIVGEVTLHSQDFRWYVLVPDTLGLPTYIFTTIRYSFTCQLQHELASSGSNARRIYFFLKSSSLLSFPARLLLYLARQRKDATSILSLYKRISSSVQTENFLSSDTSFLEDFEFDLNFHMPHQNRYLWY